MLETIINGLSRVENGGIRTKMRFLGPFSFGIMAILSILGGFGGHFGPFSPPPPKKGQIGTIFYITGYMLISVENQFIDQISVAFGEYLVSILSKGIVDYVLTTL